MRVEPSAAASTSVLVVTFKLRWVRGELAHSLFRLESLLNTILFVGFPGFVSKLWLRHDKMGRYRGLYEWDGAHLAANYVRALSRALALVSEPGSIAYAVLPGSSRDELLADPSSLALELIESLPSELIGGTGAWWRLVESDASLT